MCDFVSWISVGRKLYWLEDDMIEAKGWDFENSIGHSAIEKYYGITGIHKEGWRKIPIQIARSVNSGHMDKMAKSYGLAGVRYNNKGSINSPWWLNARKFINSIKDVKWFDNHGAIKENWKVFDTYSAARSATRSATRSVAWSAARSATESAARSATWSATRSDARSAARSAAESAAESAAWSAARLATWSAAWSATRSAAESATRSATESAAWSATESATESAAWSAAWSAAAIISEDKTAIDFFMHVWEIWKSGYGYMWDKDGIFYVYKSF